MNNAILDLFQTTKIAIPPSSTVSSGPLRLDAAFYSAESGNALASLSQSGARIEILGEIADVHCSGVRARTFVAPEVGIPFLTGSTLDVTTADDLKFLSRIFTRNITSEALQTDDILISSAGTVGKADYVHKNHEGSLASQDVIRIRLRSPKPPPGYLYAFLTSQIAGKLIVNQPAGSVIVRIYEENLERLIVPRLTPETEARIATMITASFDARADAKSLLEAADAEVHSYNRLPRLTGNRFSRSSLHDEPTIITPTVHELQSNDGTRSEFRLDAHFYNPTAQLAIANIKQSPCEVESVDKLAQVVFTGGRIKRSYVEADYGVPFLSGKNIVQIRPTGMKYLSNLQIADLQELLLRPGCTLISRSGTVGRTCFVWNNFENYAGSEDLLRVVPYEAEIDPGYLYAFLSSSYGHEQILRYRHGSVIDHVTDKHIERVLVPCPSRERQTAIGNKVREAYEKRAKAILLEDEAQKILMVELTKASGTKGV